MRQWSLYQQAIFQEIEQGKGSIVIEAVAGSGKTTTIVEAINHIPRSQSVIFCAFNKSIAEELKRRITASNARCATLHSVGFSAWRRFLGNDSWDCKINSSKVRGIVKEMLTGAERFKYGEHLPKLVSIAKGAGIVPANSSLEGAGGLTGLTEDDQEIWEDLIDFYGFDREECSVDCSRAVLSYSIEMSRQEIDFDDQLYMPIVADAPFEKFDVIFLDEAQDVNNIQMTMIQRMCKPTTRVIAVGDPHQAIYGFRGALFESMGKIKEMFKAESLPLSVSYRCPRTVVQKAQLLVSHIQSHENAPEGKVIETVHSWPLTRFKTTDAMLCRVNRPLIEIAFLLIRNRISCRVLGRDIGQGLIKIVKKQRSAVTIETLENSLMNYRIREISKFKGDEDKIRLFDDKLDTLKVFIDELNPTDPITALIASIESLFSDDSQSLGRFTLATVHKAKGLEWDRVFILDAKDYMPSKWAKQDWQKQQEVNLQYVAMTRSKDQLFYITSEVLRLESCERQSDEQSSESSGVSASQPIED